MNIRNLNLVNTLNVYNKNNKARLPDFRKTVTRRASIKNNNSKSSKIYYCSPYFWKKTFLFYESRIFKFSEKKIYSRSSVIPSSFLKQYVEIHAGKRWYGRVVTKWNIGFKFGELTWNRRMALYKAKQLKKKKKK